MYCVQGLLLCIFSTELHSMELYSVKVISAIFPSSTFSVHSSAELRSTNLSTIFFLHLQFAQHKYSPTSHDLLHSHSQLLGFQIDPLSHTPLSINSLHLHLHVYYYKGTLASNCIYTYTFHAILCISFHQSLTLT